MKIYVLIIAFKALLKPIQTFIVFRGNKQICFIALSIVLSIVISIEQIGHIRRSCTLDGKLDVSEG